MIWEKIDVSDKVFMKKFWRFTRGYFAEIVSDKSDYKYFTSNKYRRAIMEAAGKTDGYRIIPLSVSSGKNIYAICMYSVEVDGTVFLMEFCVEKSLRGLGNGKKLYFDLEKDLIEKGCKSVSLTPTTDGNRVFWQKMGYVPTGENDGDDKEIYAKKIGEDL